MCISGVEKNTLGSLIGYQLYNNSAYLNTPPLIFRLIVSNHPYKLFQVCRKGFKGKTRITALLHKEMTNAYHNTLLTL